MRGHRSIDAGAGLTSCGCIVACQTQLCALQTHSVPSDAAAAFQAQLVAWRMREHTSRQHMHGSGSRKQFKAAARRAQSHDIPRAPNPFADANGDARPPKPSGGSAFPNPFAEERERRNSIGSQQAAALDGAAPGKPSGSGAGGEVVAAAPAPDAAGALPEAAEQASQQPQQQQQPPGQPQLKQQQQQQDLLQAARSVTPKMQPEDSARSPLDQYFHSTASVSVPSCDGLISGKFGLTDATALSDITRVSCHLFSCQGKHASGASEAP